MVDVQTVIRELKISKASFYRLLKNGDIPYHVDESDLWRRRGAYKFDLEEVKQAIRRRGRVHSSESPASSDS